MTVRFAYADPPYYGCCRLYDHYHGDDGRCWDDLETHRILIERLTRDYPDGWALSASAPSLFDLAPLMPEGTRTAPWVKTFASFKPNVNPAYCWEPVFFTGGRKRTRQEPTVRDFIAGPITLQRGLTGAKPEYFCRWVLDILGWQPGDGVDDLFPGTGVMGRVVASATTDELALDFGETA